MAWPRAYFVDHAQDDRRRLLVEPRERGGGECLLDVAQRVGAEARPLAEGLQRPDVREEGVV